MTDSPASWTTGGGQALDQVASARHQQEPDLAALQPFIAAAIHEPRLRALYPFTAMGALCFRPTVGRSPAINLSVRPQGDDRYLVRGPDGAVGVADAAGSVILALGVLDAIDQTTPQR